MAKYPCALRNFHASKYLYLYRCRLRFYNIAMLTRRLLVIDDELDLLEFLKEDLADRGIDVVVADSGETALEILKNNVVHAVLSDIKMPGISGLKLLESIRMEFPELPMIFLTGNPDESGVLQALRLKSLDYISKPFELEDLRRVIDRALDIGAKQFEIEGRLTELCKLGPDAEKIVGEIRAKRRQISLLKVRKSAS